MEILFLFIVFSIFNIVFIFNFTGIVEAKSDADEGRALASVWCSACHNISANPPDGDQAPSFSELSGRGYLTQQFIADWIPGNNHPSMPNFNLPLEQRLKIAAYILSLRKDQFPETGQSDGNEDRGTLRERQDRGPLRERESPAAQGKMRKGSATGFFASREDVVTVAHAVSKCHYIWIWKNNRKYRVRNTYLSDDRDIAILRSNLTSRFFIDLGHGREPEIGTDIYSVGFPLPNVLSSKGVFSTGVVSASDGPLDDRSTSNIDTRVSGREWIAGFRQVRQFYRHDYRPDKFILA